MDCKDITNYNREIIWEGSWKVVRTWIDIAVEEEVGGNGNTGKILN